MGLFDFLRRKDERAIPDPGTPEFEAMVEGSALRDSQSVSMGEEGWSQPDAKQTIDLRGTGARDDVEQVLRDHGIDPEKKGQTIDASEVPGLRAALLRVLAGGVPNSGGFGRGIPKKNRD